ncbi:member of major facilitator superfamily multidrug-resistance, DHA1 sub-family [Rickenella mellea]|uniref:Member of major facilitator superfamily multidrug-resistance, DHA1 sub-family n=1 Tax=Rickenella mellea TaxID=50990 RepID=A0A4Y7PW42_9AGAM|nr:member of major facilitator superfamily multidrug-resistance, DHA1 sub-family [Rickenella mellea]
MSPSSEAVVDEESPLLRPAHDAPAKETPLPWKQYSIVLFLQVAEPLTFHVVSPFLPQLVRELGVTGGDDKKLGYYVGLVHSAFFATETLTVLHWSRASDYIGRKPVVATGLFGVSLAMYIFGLSKTFWALLISRCLAGGLTGNVGVMKSVMAELTDSTNVARAFAYSPIAWSTGATLGPLVGGVFSHPAENFPRVFGGSEFLKTYPYFLPCAIAGTATLIAGVITVLFFKETNPTCVTFWSLVKREKSPPILAARHKTDSSGNVIISENILDGVHNDEPLPLRSLLTPRVIAAAGNYAILSWIEISFRAIQIMFWAMPTAIGGLGMSPRAIGTWLALVGLSNGVFQGLFFADIHKKVGTRTLYLCGLSSFFPMFALFPITGTVVKVYGIGWVVWVLVGMQLTLSLFFTVCFGCVFIYLTAASPNKRSLGGTNGIAQTLVSITRCIGPASATSLFSLSLEHGYLGGVLVYYVMILLSMVAFAGGLYLPKKVWDRAQY